MTRYLAWGLGGTGVCLLLACGGTVSLREGGGSSGGTSAAGNYAVGGTQQLPPIGGATQGPPGRDPCVYASIEELCVYYQCPTSPADLLHGCEDALSFTSASTECGGSVVTSSSGFVATSWYFDADGKLTGALVSNDVVEACPDGHTSSDSVYGTTCAAQGKESEACVPAEGCTPEPLVCDDCPAHPDVVLANYCGLTSTLSLTTTPTTCGGSILLVQTNTGDLRYCFDSQGRLVGSMSRPAATGVETPSGSDCIADGMPLYACADDPG